MFLLIILRSFLLSMAMLGAQGAYGVTQWVKLIDGDRRCSMTCNRAGLDNVLSAKKTPLGESLCAGRSKDRGKLLPGLQTLSLDFGCRITSGQTVASEYCLCADDGVEGKQDFAWLEPSAKGRCDTTCQKQGVKKYGYAVYTSYMDQSWAHVCMASNGSVGFVGGGKTACQTYGGAENDFTCMCTRGFSGDLESGFDP